MNVIILFLIVVVGYKLIAWYIKQFSDLENAFDSLDKNIASLNKRTIVLEKEVMREAAVMLIIKDGLVLGISRRDNKNIFGLSGGKRETNETLAETAIRECFEETGVKVNSCVQIYKQEEPARTPDGLSFFTYCFFATDWEGEPKNSEEGEVKWLTAHELINGPEIAGGKGAFPIYNRNALFVFKHLFPNIKVS